MSGRIEAIYGRGTTGASGELEHYYGTKAEFPDVNWSSTEAVKPINSGHTVTCIWVKNDSSGTLAKRCVVKWKTAYFGTRVGDRADAGDIGCGVVDEHIPSTVADGLGFWLVVHGPTILMSDGAGTLAQGDTVCTAGTNNGYVAKQTAAPADTTAAMVQVNTRVGMVTESVTNVAGTTFRAFVDFLRNL
jgi:hypothetical protein